ncbi:hypothetical protein [Fodinicola acaciae]|uniref:hypothetical protein n=1 Tax=Fodinicola acaciae TaxID=2681555 RepID=UPI0013D753C1|nr:hypothetical protein [Fodinicola acaciae]
MTDGQWGQPGGQRPDPDETTTFQSPQAQPPAYGQSPYGQPPQQQPDRERSPFEQPPQQVPDPPGVYEPAPYQPQPYEPQPYQPQPYQQQEPPPVEETQHNPYYGQPAAGGYYAGAPQADPYGQQYQAPTSSQPYPQPSSGQPSPQPTSSQPYPQPTSGQPTQSPYGQPSSGQPYAQPGTPDWHVSPYGEPIPPLPAGPARKRRGRRLLSIVAGVVVGLLVLGGLAVGGVWYLNRQPDTGATQASDDGGRFAAYPASAGAGIDQRLYDVAAGHRGQYVAVGVASGASTQPLFLRSTDSGRKWQPARPDPAGIAATTPSDEPDQVAFGPRGWVALGSADFGTALWTSSDGSSWLRRPSPAAFRNNDRVSDLTTTSTGYLAVGYSGATGAAGAVVWTSADGVTWTRAPATQAPPNSHDVRYDAVAVRGQTIVVGGRFADAKNQYGHFFAVSRDAGKSYQLVVGPEFGTNLTLANKLFGYVNAITATDSGFVAVAQAGGQNTWDGVVLTSGDGLSWQVHKQPAMATAQDDIPAAVVQVGGRIVVAGHRTDERGGVDDLDGMLTQGSVNSVGNVSVGGLTGAGTQRIWALATDGSSVVAVGNGASGSDATAATWVRGSSGSWSAVTISADASGVRPALSIAAVRARPGGGVLAIGDSRGQPALWQSGDADKFAMVDLPAGATGTPAARPQLSDLANGPAGWLAVGSVSTGPTPEGVFVSSKDGSSWTDATPPVVRHPTVYGRNSIYYGSSPLAVCAYGKGWLVVGYRRDNGKVSAAVWRSADGVSWLPGSGVKPDDLLATSDTTERTINDVVAAGTTAYAVGGAEKNGTSQPTIYTSTDGLHWSAQVLAPPNGSVGGELKTVSALPNGTLVAAGVAGTADGKQSAVAYTSTDKGKTWSSLTLPAASAAAGQSERAAVTDSTVVGSRLVVAGALGSRGNPDAAVWSTADGRSWRFEPLKDSRLTGPGYQHLSTVAAIGNDLVAVGEAYTQSGQSLIVLRQPLPS